MPLGQGVFDRKILRPDFSHLLGATGFGFLRHLGRLSLGLPQNEKFGCSFHSGSSSAGPPARESGPRPNQELQVPSGQSMGSLRLADKRRVPKNVKRAMGKCDLVLGLWALHEEMYEMEAIPKPEDAVRGDLLGRGDGVRGAGDPSCWRTRAALRRAESLEGLSFCVGKGCFSMAMKHASTCSVVRCFRLSPRQGGFEQLWAFRIEICDFLDSHRFGGRFTFGSQSGLSHLWREGGGVPTSPCGIQLKPVSHSRS